MCGNHSTISISLMPVTGSPPRVREPLRKLPLGGRYRGITPACAGTTAMVLSFVSIAQDHPRVCGNHSSFDVDVFAFPGSPPRVREPPSALAIC